MIDRPLVRALVTSVALAAGTLLAGCNSDEISLANNAKANQPVPAKLVADMTAVVLFLVNADGGQDVAILPGTTSSPLGVTYAARF